MLGVILAGGRSRRMEGLDKTRLQRDGRRVLEHLAELLRATCGACSIVAREDQCTELEALDLGDVYADLFPGRGPLGGLYTALEETGEDVLLVACDLPFLKVPLLERLRRTFEAATLRHFACLPRSPDPSQPDNPWRLEPLCAVWSRHCKRPAYLAIENQELSVTAFAKSLNPITLDLSVDELLQLRNVNTRKELQHPGLDLPPG